MPLDVKKPTPLYLQIVDDLKAQIVSGRWNVGDQLASQHELARHYHVSLITVKKALAHLSHEGWVYSRVGKGSFVARRAVSSPPAVSKSIGLVLQNLQSPYFSLIVQAAEECAYQRGYNILLSNSFGRPEKEEGQIRHFRKIGVAGLIIASQRHVYHANETIRFLQREGFPFVMVTYMADRDVPYVGTDHEQGGYLATQHLLRLGYRRIAYINAERGNLVGELRRQGYVRALEDYGRKVDKRLILRMPMPGERKYFDAGMAMGACFPTLPVKPDAVFLYNDLAALGFQQALRDRGLSVPDDVAIVGFDNIEQCDYAPVPLTTIQQPTSQIGSDAVDVLVRRIAHQDAPVRTILMPSLIIRRSCGAGKEPTRPRVQLARSG